VRCGSFRRANTRQTRLAVFSAWSPCPLVSLRPSGLPVLFFLVSGVLHGIQQQPALLPGILEIDKKWRGGKLPDEWKRR